ncbi:hypothetical protein KKD20_05325, partial [Patescibacteria group bacterium]|nr:hypothetical protein [Patescibacteria group bacterium]
MTIDGWKLSDFPIAYGPEDYDDARKEIAEKVGPVSGVKTILEWGKPRYPGISDIDFFVVFEQESP